MGISLKEFNELFKNNVLDILWAQWTTLGVASNVEEVKNKIIDIESLLIATFILGDYDKRLFSASVEWLLKNGNWINISRLKRIGKFFSAQENVFDGLLSVNTIIGLLQNSINEGMPEKYRKILSGFRKRGIVSEIVIKKPALLQLLLRGVFGINARVEVMIYLLSGKSGNSLAISKEIFYDQKVVYRILEDWRKSRIIAKGRARNYSIIQRKEWLKLFEIKKMPEYINQGRMFALFTRILKSISMKPWFKNEYMVSSLFRDIYEDMGSVAECLNIRLPEPDLYKGNEYFIPFAESLLKISKKIKLDRRSQA